MVSAGPGPKIQQVHAVAIYDSKTGRIRHMHRVFILEGAKVPDRKSIENEALTQAKRLGHKVDELKLLYIPHLANYNAMYRVDVRKQALIELQPPPRPSMEPKKRSRPVKRGR